MPHSRRPLFLDRRGAAALIALSLSAAAQAQPSLTPEALFERLAPSVWVVHTLDGERRPLMQGSAVVIGPGRLITNCHVLRRARSVSVGRDNMSFGATLEHPDTERDLCQLKVANFTAPAVAIAPAESLRAGAPSTPSARRAGWKPPSATACSRASGAAPAVPSRRCRSRYPSRPAPAAAACSMSRAG
ncbi:S1 family peptidase [Hydrogenophaga borbori]|uniref:S1 family peptidase n=1 Tax=Hydrogenophaga borbori TaxID=2294117 RepID=UPI003CCC5229